MEQAEQRFKTGTAGVRVLQYAPEGARNMVKRYMALFACMPMMSFRAVRWCFRKPGRVFGLGGFVWMMMELMRHLAIYTWVNDKAIFLYLKVEETMKVLFGGSQQAADWKESLEDWYEKLSHYVTPWRIPVYVLALFALKKLWFEAERSDSPMSTPARSGRGTP